MKPTWYHTENEYIRLLHLPYTIWHLSYVLLGAAIAPVIFPERLAATLIAFFLAMGVSAHYFDELTGRPLKTKIPERTLKIVAWTSLLCACAIGVLGMVLVTFWLLPFILFGGFIVVAYNLEWFNGKFHTDNYFAIAWGSFPILVSYFINALTITIPVVLLAIGCYLLSRAQRELSFYVRRIRRKSEIHYEKEVYSIKDLGIEKKEVLIYSSERALKYLFITIFFLSIAFLLSNFYRGTL